jgi:hypothetical protein
MSKKEPTPPKPSGSNPKSGVTNCTACAPSWFTEGATSRERAYSADDLNLIAQVVYGEAMGFGAGGKAGYPPEELADEKANIAGVIFNRARAHPELTVWDIVDKEGQFPSVSKEGENGKFKDAAREKAGELKPEECADLERAIAAVRVVFTSPNPGKYKYGSFWAYPRHAGHRIGGTVFF